MKESDANYLMMVVVFYICVWIAMYSASITKDESLMILGMLGGSFSLLSFMVMN